MYINSFAKDIIVSAISNPNFFGGGIDYDSKIDAVTKLIQEVEKIVNDKK